MSLRHYWYIACASRALRGRPRAVTIFGENFVLWRDAAGQPAALLDRCAHRNAPLSGGTVARGCIQCPYHGWRFEGSGACASIPSLAPERPMPVTARVPAFAVRESQGYIWLCPGGAAPGGEPFAFPHLGERGWTSFRMQTRFGSSVEACLENFLDCPHTAHVHRGWFRNPDPRELTALVRRRAAEVEIEFQDEPTGDSLIARLLYPKGRRLKHTDRFLMPNLSRVDYEFGPEHHFIITSQCTPVSEHETEVYTVITFRYGRLAPLVRLFFEPMSRHILRQDVRILARHGEQIRRYGGEQYAHAETDLLALQMQALRRQAERGGAAEPGETERRVRIRF